MCINKKLWFALLMLLIFVVPLSVASVNAEGDSQQTSEETTAVFMTDEESYELFRQLGASEEVIKALRELRSTFNELHARGASTEEAEAVIKEFNLRLEKIKELEENNPQVPVGWGYSSAGIYATCAPWARAIGVFSMNRGPWYSTFYQTGGAAFTVQGSCNRSYCRKITNVGFNGGSWDYNLVAAVDPSFHSAYCGTSW